MTRHYQLWDTQTGNLMDTFTTQTEALVFVRDVVTAEDPSVVDGWALGWGDDHGDGGAIAEGQRLAELALSVAVAPPPSRAG